MHSNTIFISYSHAEPDRSWLARVHAHLRPLERRGLQVTIWDDTQIQSGMEWQQEIANRLRNARIALLLISANFFQSDFVWRSELPVLLHAAENTGTVILPLILSPSRFSREPQLAQYQTVNDPKKPLISLSPGEQEQVLDDMASRVEALSFAWLNTANTKGALDGEPLDLPHSSGVLPPDSAAAVISEHAARVGVTVGKVTKSPLSPFGTASYRAHASDGKGVIYCHADGAQKARSFYVRKGIGWFYECVLLGVSCRLGLPISNEEIAETTRYPTSWFEGGYIEWSPSTKVARAVIRDKDRDRTLAERLL